MEERKFTYLNNILLSLFQEKPKQLLCLYASHIVMEIGYCKN